MGNMWLRKVLFWKRNRKDLLIEFPASVEKSVGINDGIIVAFHTSDEVYTTEARRMRLSADRLGLRVVMQEFASTGNWTRNAALKADFLLEQRKALRGPLLYVDVDAVFHRNPWDALSDYSGDIAVFYDENSQLLSGTILIADTQAALDLLQVWKNRCAEAPEIWDQVALEQVVEKDRTSAHPKYRVDRLPVSFCWIFDRVENGKAQPIFIEHLQASRQLKTENRKRFGRVSSRLRRRQARVAQIEAVLLNTNSAETIVAP